MEPQRPDDFRLPASPTIPRDADQWIQLQPFPAETLRLPGVDVIPIQFEFPLEELLVPGSQPHVFDLCAYDAFYIAPESCILFEVGFRICIAPGLVGHLISHPALKLPPAVISVEPISFLTSSTGLPGRQGMAIEITNNSHRLQIVPKGQRLAEIYFSRIQPVTPHYWGLRNPPPVHRQAHPFEYGNDSSFTTSGSSTPSYLRRRSGDWNDWVAEAEAQPAVRLEPEGENEPTRRTENLTSLTSLRAILDAQDPYYPDVALVEEVTALMDRLRASFRPPSSSDESLNNEVMLINSRQEEHGGIHCLGLMEPDSSYGTLEVLGDDHTYEDMEFDTPFTLTPGDSFPSSPSPTWDEPLMGWEDYWEAHWRGGRPGDAHASEQVVRPRPQLAVNVNNPRLGGGRVDSSTPPPVLDEGEFPPLPPPRRSGKWTAPAAQLSQALRRLVNAPAPADAGENVDSSSDVSRGKASMNCFTGCGRPKTQ